MSRATNVIDVLIVGDAKKLAGAVKDADASMGGLLKSAGKLFLASAAVSEGFDFIQGSLDKADDFNDAFDNLAGTIGEIDAQKVKDIAFNLTDIGLSADEVGKLADAFASFATAAGVSAPTISALTPQLLDVASAVAAKTGKTLDEVVTDIGKAAAGTQKPVSEYGVVIDKALNPDEQLTSILAQLEAKFGTAKTAADDFAGSQEELGAKWDNLMVKIGDGLDGPLSGILDFINDEIDAIPGAIEGWKMLGKAVEDFGRTALAPLGNVNDLIGGIGDAISNVTDLFGDLFGQADRLSESRVRQLNSLITERNGQGTP